MTWAKRFPCLQAAAALVLSMAAPAIAASTRSYFSPDYLGQPLAFCLEGNRECGRAAATAWCKANGYDDAISFARRTISDADQLRLADTGNLCTSERCIGFRQIRCFRAETDRQIPPLPTCTPDKACVTEPNFGALLTTLAAI